jgi:AcrR family transcriptional regulator
MKDSQYWSVLDHVVRLEVAKGHQRWKITDLARASGVGRPLIYYYFGKSKATILEAAMKAIGDEFFGLSAERLQLWESGEIKQSVLRTRELMQKAPHVPQFYFHWRHQKNPIGDQLKQFEKRYTQKLKRLRPELNTIQAQALFAVFFGLVLVPELDEAVLGQVVDGLFDKIREKASKA